jgi:resuscitation-promoting factor RpfB
MMQKKFQRLQLRFERYRRIRFKRQFKQVRQRSRHPFAVPFLTFAVLLSLTLTGYLVARQTNKLPPVQDARIVIISHDHQQQVIPTKEHTVGALLDKLHLALNQGDIVEPARNTPINQDEFRINVYRAVPVEVVDGTQRTFTYSAAKTPRAIAQQAGSTLYPDDHVSNTPTENFVADASIGPQVVIDRATPVNVDLYGTSVVLRTHAATVGDLIKEKGIKLQPKDQVVPALNTPITANQQVSFIRTGTKVLTVTEAIAMPVQSINDNSLAYGTSAIRQQGSPGQQVVTYSVNLVNNVETSRTAIQTVVTKPAVTQIEVVGTSISGIKGDMALAGIAPGDYQYADYIISHESGWCPTKAQGQYGGCPAYAGSVPSYGGYGLCQSTPGSKMASAGADWATNPITQLRWCSGYASRYGGWAGAYNHWVANHSW